MTDVPGGRPHRRRDVGPGIGARHHLAVHLDGEAAAVVDELRARWDPTMRRITPAHVTVAYPEETVDRDLLLTRAARVARESPAFQACLARFATRDDGRGGVVALVDDVDGGLETMRDRLLLPPQRFSGFPFHATIAHPRTAQNTVGCWAQLGGTGLDVSFTVDALLWTVTGNASRTVLETFPLTGAPLATRAMTGGLVLRGASVLLGLRHPERSSYPNVWDVPGGHVEPGESPRRALHRELREELGIDPTIGAPWRRIADPGAGLDLSLFLVRDWCGEVSNQEPQEHVSLRWFTADALADIPLADPRYLQLLREALARS